MPEIVYYDVTFYETVDDFDDIPKYIMKRGQQLADFATAKNMGIYAYGIRPPQYPSTPPVQKETKKKVKEEDE